MKFVGILAPLALVSSALAAPGWGDWATGGGSGECGGGLIQDDANDIVNKFAVILSHADVAVANQTAQALIGDGFSEKGDSINILAGFPLGSTSFSGKQAYINGVLNAPGIDGITTNKALVAGSSYVLWYWTITGLGSRQVPVNGFNLFQINQQKQVVASFVEFNSIAWGIDTGYTTTDPTGKTLPVA